MMDPAALPLPPRPQWIAWISVVLGLLGTPALALDGAALYRAQCARCHGPEGRGNGPEAAVLAHPPRDLRDGFLARHSVDDLVARVRSGRTLPLTVDPTALGKALDDVDAVTAHIRRIPAIDWGEARRGRHVYLQRCEGCHGPTGEGARPNVPLDRIPPDLGGADERSRLVGDRRDLAVRHALPGMLGLKQVPGDPEARALSAWVAVLSPGYRLYERYCAGCHGEDGRPPPGLDAADRPKVVFDAAYLASLAPSEFDDAATHMVVTKKPRMPHLAAEVSEGEARAIVEYLRTLP
jgi:mono/diheme cytochrome c family protein